MAPNIYLAVKKATSPHTWFRRSGSTEKFPKEFHANHPVPGIYSIHSRYGLVLLAKDSDHGLPLPEPIRLKKSDITKKYYLMPDWLDRTTHALVTDPDGITAVRLMFRLDDGISWVACEDANGNKIRGPWPRYCIDQITHRFRLMARGDSPEYRTRVSVGDKDHSSKAIALNKEPAPEYRPVESSALSPVLTNSSASLSPSKMPTLTAANEMNSTPETLGPPTPATPGTTTFMLPGPAVNEEFFSAEDLEERLEKLRIKEQSRSESSNVGN